MPVYLPYNTNLATRGTWPTSIYIGISIVIHIIRGIPRIPFKCPRVLEVYYYNTIHDNSLLFRYVNNKYANDNMLIPIYIWCTSVVRRRTGAVCLCAWKPLNRVESHACTKIVDFRDMSLYYTSSTIEQTEDVHFLQVCESINPSCLELSQSIYNNIIYR